MLEDEGKDGVSIVEERKGMSRSARSVDHFCDDHEISKAHFYNLLKSGKGPAIMKIGRRTLISDEAAAEWRRRMEAMAGGEKP